MFYSTETPQFYIMKNMKLEAAGALQSLRRGDLIKIIFHLFRLFLDILYKMVIFVLSSNEL